MGDSAKFDENMQSVPHETDLAHSSIVQSVWCENRFCSLKQNGSHQGCPWLGVVD